MCCRWLAPEIASAVPQAAGRAAAKSEPRNMITLAAVAMAEFRGTPPDITYSTDMFTVFISEKGQVHTVYMASGSLAKLKAENLKACVDIAVKGLPPSAKARASIPSYATFSATGEVLSAVLLFIDSNIPDSKYYHIYPIDGSGKGRAAVLKSTLFVAMLPADFNENMILHQIWSQIIIPKTAKMCHDLCAANAGDYASIGPPSRAPSLSQARPSAPVATPNSSTRSVSHSKRSTSEPEPSFDNGNNADVQRFINERMANMRREPDPSPKRVRLDDPLPPESLQFLSPIHCMDGDCPQIAVLMDRLKMQAIGLQCIQDLCKKKYKDIKWRFIKFAAGCSMIQSPNDVGPVHAQAKAQTTIDAEFRCVHARTIIDF